MSVSGAASSDSEQDQASLSSMKHDSLRSWDSQSSGGTTMHPANLAAASVGPVVSPTAANTRHHSSTHEVAEGEPSSIAECMIASGPTTRGEISDGNDKTVKTTRTRRETPEQRSRWLARQQLHNKKRRKGGSTVSLPTDVIESNKQRNRLARQAVSNQKRQRADTPASELDETLETEEHRQKRLLKQREYARRRRSQQLAAAMTSQPERAGFDCLDDMNSSRPRLSQSSRQNIVNQLRLCRSSIQDSPHTVDGREVETVARRDIRLGKQKEYARQHRQLLGLASSKNITRRTTEPALHPVDNDTIATIAQRLQEALGAEGLDECVCAVCDRLSLRSTAHIVNDDSSVFQAIQERLVRPTDLPSLPVTQFSSHAMHASLEGLLLSRKGLRTSPRGVDLTVCNDCHESLSKDTTDPPKFAIANGFFVGQLPDQLLEATWIETIMTQLVTVVAQTRVMRGGRHRAIRSHCMVFDATPGPPATLLPRRVDHNGAYNIVLAGPMTTSQTDTIRKLHQARGLVVRELLEFYISHNRFYDGVEVSNVRLGSVNRRCS